MEEIQKEGADPKEIQQEEEFLKEPPKDEIRSSIAERYGLDVDIDGELIEKLVVENQEKRKDLSTAIAQKRSWREKALAQTGKKAEDKPQPPKELPKEEDFEKILDQKVNAKLEEKELDSFDLSDELKKEISSYAKLNNVSIKKAFNSSYVQFRKKEEDEKKKSEEASASSSHKKMAGRDFSEVDPASLSEDLDLMTEEGREEHAKRLKQWRESQK